MGREGDRSSPRDELAAHRAGIDAVDHEVLELLARRNELVTRVATLKRELGMPIRDSERESQVIADCCARAAPLGLSEDLIEGLFRMVLWDSRNRQAELRTEVPAGTRPRTVAIIGGKGEMGRCMSQLFSGLGHRVIIADLDTELSPRDAARAADVVVVSVPIRDTVEVIRQLGPWVRAEALLMDVTSVKREPLAAMLEHSDASVVGTHPLFGPPIHSLQGQRIVITPGRGDEWLAWVEEMFHAQGLEIEVATAERHDEAMGIVQVLTHFSLEVLGKTLARLQIPLDETLRFTSPIYLMELLMVGRHFAQSSELYGAIQMGNAGTPAVTKAYIEAARELQEQVVDGDQDGFQNMFEEVREFLGSFADHALDRSTRLIDRIVERM